MLETLGHTVYVDQDELEELREFGCVVLGCARLYGELVMHEKVREVRY